MATRINVQGHVDRYKETDLGDLRKLIKGLTELADEITKNEIDRMEAAVQLLKNGELPPVEEKPAPKPRTSKKKAAKLTEETDDKA